jgi:beta-galactosidase
VSGLRTLPRLLGGGLAFGGDYNPEQWDAAVWKEDGELMRRAGVNLVSLGVFAWSHLEPDEGHYAFGWLDAAMDRLHGDGVRVALATPTASPPPWFSLAHPEALPVREDGTRLTHGSRDTYCLTSPAYRNAAARIAGALAERYAGHPALALWHIHNEYATVCWCDAAAAAFRVWLRDRHGSLDALNEAWGTAFWSQRYSAWEQVMPPRATQWHRNPGQLLDYRRFWSDTALAAYREQRDAIRRHTPPGTEPVPATTNLMLPDYQNLDLWAFGRAVDVVGVDHYVTDASGPVGAGADVAYGADRARSLGGGRPWLLVEQGANTVYQRDRVLPKAPGETLRASIGHVARGADGVMFFQWRQSAAGAELWHSAMVPHAGPDSRIFREVAATGAAVGALAEVAGSRVRAGAAVLHDADAWWALDSDGMPSAELDYPGALRRAHRVLWDAGVTADLAHPADPDLGRYRLLVAPSLYLVSAEGAAALRRYVAGGGTLLVEYFSGVVDARHRVWPGDGHPGALRDVLGVRIEEFRPLAAGATAALSDGTHGTVWSEDLRCEGALTVTAYAEGPLAGKPAVTRHDTGAGTAYYVSTRLDPAGYAALVGRALGEAGVRPEVPGLPPGVEAVRRHGPERSWLFLLNHTAGAAEVPGVRGTDLLTGATTAPGGGLRLPAGGVAVLREPG